MHRESANRMKGTTPQAPSTVVLNEERSLVYTNHFILQLKDPPRVFALIVKVNHSHLSLSTLHRTIILTLFHSVSVMNESRPNQSLMSISLTSVTNRCPSYQTQHSLMKKSNNIMHIKAHSIPLSPVSDAHQIT